MRTRLMHVRANVFDLKRALEWYKQVLVFKLETVWPFENPDYVHFEAKRAPCLQLWKRRATFPESVQFLHGGRGRCVGTVEGPGGGCGGAHKFTLRDQDGKLPGMNAFFQRKIDPESGIGFTREELISWKRMESMLDEGIGFNFLTGYWRQSSHKFVLYH